MRACISVLLLLLAIGATKADFVTDINCSSPEYGCGNEGETSVEELGGSGHLQLLRPQPSARARSCK